MNNSVQHLQSVHFHQLSLHEKIELKNKGRSLPQIFGNKKRHPVDVDHSFANSTQVCMLKIHGYVDAIIKLLFLLSMLIIWRRPILDQKWSERSESFKSKN